MVHGIAFSERKEKHKKGKEVVSIQPLNHFSNHQYTIHSFNEQLLGYYPMESVYELGGRDESDMDPILKEHSPIHTNEFCSESVFMSPVCKSNKVSLCAQLTQSAI